MDAQAHIFDTNFNEEYSSDDENNAQNDTTEMDNVSNDNIDDGFDDQNDENDDNSETNVFDGVIFDEDDDEEKETEEAEKPRDFKKEYEFGLKGSKIDENKNVICLDCGKIFSKRASYRLHRRL